MTQRAIFLVAGGTGGHMFPAQALGKVLRGRGYEVELVTDARGITFGASFPARAVHILSSATPTAGGVGRKIMALIALGWGLVMAFILFARQRPLYVVGFGGYPTVPPLIAAWLLRIPCFIHEQNAVMGRANVFLAPFVKSIATGFPYVGRLPQKWHYKVQVTGNPVRPEVRNAASLAYNSDFLTFRILVTGGSQGARVMSDIVPAAIDLLSSEVRARIFIVQQARGEDENKVRSHYARLAVRAEVAPFFAHLPHEIAQAHLVIARAGASTVSELAVIGRPSVLVPFPHALDQDQAMNARYLEEQHAAVVVAETDFTPAWLAHYIQTVINAPANLISAAARAQQAGKPFAAEALADYILNPVPHAPAAETE